MSISRSQIQKQITTGGKMKKLKPVSNKNKGLKKLPKSVRNKMGFMKKGGKVK